MQNQFVRLEVKLSKADNLAELGGVGSFRVFFLAKSAQDGPKRESEKLHEIPLGK